MVEVFIELKLNMETIFDTDFHFHLGHFFGLLNIAVVVKDGKIDFFDNSSFEVSIYDDSDEISYSTGDTIKCLILFFKIGKLELEAFVLSKDTSRL